MGSNFSRDDSSQPIVAVAEELPRNQNGKRPRPATSSEDDDNETDLEASYRATMLMAHQQEQRSQATTTDITKTTTPRKRRRAKRQRIEDYTPTNDNTCIYNKNTATVAANNSSNSSNSNSNYTASYYRTTFGAYWSLRGLSDKLCVILAQAFLSLAESSTRHATAANHKYNSHLFPDQELFQSVSDMLDDFQSLEPDILTRGWRMLCVCSLVQQKERCNRTNDHDDQSDSNSDDDHDHDDQDQDALSNLPDNDVGTVIMGMKLHNSSVRLQLLGCRALKILLDTERATWQQLAEESFVPVMMAAMKHFPDDLVLQGLMMSFLGMMIRENEERLQHELLELGIVEVILAALKEFDDNTRLIHTGCLALLQISASLQEAREKIVEKNGHVLVYRILEQHMRDELLLIVSLNTLSRLLSVQRIDALPLDEVVHTILACMEMYPQDESVQTHALVSLLRLGEHTRIPSETAIRKIVPAMTAFRQSRPLVFIACVVIRSIIANSTQPATVLQHLLDVGGVECIVNASKDHESRAGIQQIVQLLLSVLLVHQQTSGVPSAFRGTLRVVGMMSRIDFDSDEDDGDW
ncbi:MAG: hypothetical protein SGBAC_003709 [Bacillariaceae sp.]